MLDRIIKVITTFYEVPEEQINEDSSLVADLGLNSLDVVNLVIAFEDEFSIQVPDERIKDFKKVGDIMEFVKAKQ